MASIDFTTLGLGALIGIGCRKQLKACARVAANTAASLAGVAATAAQQVASEASKSAEQQAAEAWTQQVYQKIDQQFAGQANGQKKNG